MTGTYLFHGCQHKVGGFCRLGFYCPDCTYRLSGSIEPSIIILSFQMPCTPTTGPGFFIFICLLICIYLLYYKISISHYKVFILYYMLTKKRVVGFNPDLNKVASSLQFLAQASLTVRFLAPKKVLLKIPLPA